MISFFTTINNNCYSQNQFSRNFTIGNGLPSNCIRDIFKDSRGIYWIGTEEGLCRFDGVNFRVYTQQDGLPGNKIWSITEDREGNLWLACFGKGISRFDGRTFTNYSTGDGLVNNDVRKIKYSKKSNGLLIGTVDGFSFMKDSIFTSFHNTSVSDRNLLQVTDFIDCDSTIYLLNFSDNKCCMKFNPYTKKIQFLPENCRYHLKSNISTCSFITSAKDTIIADQCRGITIYSKDSVRSIGNIGIVFEIAEDKEGSLWFASWNDGRIPEYKTKGGIYRLKNRKVDFYSNYLGISTQLCWCLYYDENEHLMWIGTLDNGVYLYPMSGIEYTRASDMNKERPAIHDILNDSKGNTWISVGDRIIRKGETTTTYQLNDFQEFYFDFIKKKYSYLNDSLGSYFKYKNLIEPGLFKFGNPCFPNKKLELPSYRYRSSEYSRLLKAKITSLNKFFEDTNGDIWIKTNLGIFSFKGSTLSNFHYNNDVFGNCFFLEKNTSMWILYHNVMERYDLDNNKLNEKIKLRNNPTFSSYCKYIRDKDTYWIYNNSDGIFRYESGKLQRFDNLKTQIDLSFNALTIDKRKNLIAGTNSGNIYVLKITNDSAIVTGTLSQEDGIRGADIQWVLTDNSNRLWFATNKGLNMINLENLYSKGKKDVCFFNEENGFFDKQSFKAQLDSKGFLNVISADNLIKIDPDELVRSTDKTCKLKIERIEVNFIENKWGNDFKTDSWTGLPESGVDLPYDKNTLVFYFDMLQVGEPSKAQYSCKLEGLQTKWTQFSPDPRAVFTTLRKGRYTLKIRGRLLSSPARFSETEYSFRILPPWWQTWWFCSLAIMTTLMIFLFAYNRKMVQIKRDMEINRKMADLKMEVLKSQMNPHFIFNTFNSIQKHILKKDARATLDYISDFASLLRQTFDNSTKEYIPLSDEIRYLTSYIGFEKQKSPNFEYTIDTKPDIDTEETLIPPMLIQPFVENAIIHGIRNSDKKGNLSVRFELSLDESMLICTVEDNGVGRTKSSEINKSRKIHQSYGTMNTLQRIKLLGYGFEYVDLYDDRNSPEGTKAILTIHLL